jgi:hypothetical protein
MPLNGEDKEFPDNSDPEEIRQALIDVLRKSDGAQLRSLLKALRGNPHSGRQSAL